MNGNFTRVACNVFEMPVKKIFVVFVLFVVYAKPIIHLSVGGWGRYLPRRFVSRWLKEDVSNMAVVDVKLVTGFSVREGSLENLRSNPALNLKRHDIDGQHVVLYFDQIKDMTFSIDIHQDTLVKKLKPAVVKVYDYYEPVCRFTSQITRSPNIYNFSGKFRMLNRLHKFSWLDQVVEYKHLQDATILIIENQAKVMYRIGEAECYGNKIDTECPRCMTLENPQDLINAIVQCNSTVTRIKSMHGMLKIIKAYAKAKKVVKKELDYKIPDFCPCEEIYDSEKAIVIGQKSYFNENGEKTTIVLNSGTTLLKWTGKSMKPYIKAIKRKLGACKRKRKGKGKQ